MSIFYTFLLLVSFPIYATTFRLVELTDQLKESDGILIGHYLKSKSIMLDNGTIATQMIFKMDKEWGFQSDLFGIGEIIIHYPGGTYDGQTSRIDGVPSFTQGEKVALLAKNIDNRFWGLNLGLGSYKVISYGSQTMLVNSLFPSDPKIGQLTLADFEFKVKALKGTGLKTVKVAHLQEDTGRIPASETQGKNRSIASNKAVPENKKTPEHINVYWLIAVLGLAAGVSRIIGKKGQY